MTNQMDETTQLYEAAFERFSNAMEVSQDLFFEPHDFVFTIGESSHNDYLNNFKQQQLVTQTVFEDIYKLKRLWQKLPLHSLATYAVAIEEATDLISHKNEDIYRSIVYKVDDILEFEPFAIRSGNLRQLEECRTDLRELHLAEILPTDREGQLMSIGSLVDEYYANKKLDLTISSVQTSAQETINTLKELISEGRKLHQTKEIETIGIEYAKSAKDKNRSFVAAFILLACTLPLIPFIFHTVAIRSGVQSGIFSANHPALLPTVAGLTFGVSGMLFKLSWTFFQQRSLLESRAKL